MIKKQSEQQLIDITNALSKLDKKENGYSVKQYELMRKRVEERLNSLKSGEKDGRYHI